MKTQKRERHRFWKKRDGERNPLRIQFIEFETLIENRKESTNYYCAYRGRTRHEFTSKNGQTPLGRPLEVGGYYIMLGHDPYAPCPYLRTLSSDKAHIGANPASTPPATQPTTPP